MIINKRRINIFGIIIAVLLISLGIGACSSNGGNNGVIANSPDWENYEMADMSGYSVLENYDKTFKYVEMTNTQVLEEMAKGSTFVVYYGFANCPWCNHIVGPLNDVALEEEVNIVYVDTRRDPSWQNNLDIDNYDKFAETFKEYLTLDENDLPHLYVPDVYFIKKGKPISHHSGTVPDHGDSSISLTEEQVETLKEAFREGIKSLQ